MAGPTYLTFGWASALPAHYIPAPLVMVQDTCCYYRKTNMT